MYFKHLHLKVTPRNNHHCSVSISELRAGVKLRVDLRATILVYLADIMLLYLYLCCLAIISNYDKKKTRITSIINVFIFPNIM